MKRAVQAICTAMAVFLLVLISSENALAATYQKFRYQKIDNGKYIEITGYSGNSAKIKIPSKISGKKVTSIGKEAFSGKAKLTSITIPSTVKTIKAYAFYNCKKLTKVTLPSSVKTISSYAFGYKSGRKNVGKFTINGNFGSAAYRYAYYNDLNFNVQNLKVSAMFTERLKSTQTNLKWDMCSGADGYLIYRADASGKSYKKIADAGNAVTYEDKDIANGAVYFYKVKPYKEANGKKFYGAFSQAASSEWGKYNKADFTFVKRNKAEKSLKQGIYYEIFVRSFADSNGDGIGDFNGLTSKLDYLQELGVEGIWLMPVNNSPSYHGYDVTNYTGLNPDYGTEEEFRNLLSEAHKRGIKVIMDFVINHTSSRHPWFLSANADVNSPYRDYYRYVSKYDTDNYDVWDMSPWGSTVWQKSGDYYYYSAFYGLMPDLNYNNPAVRQEIKDAAGKWLNMGVDGFRLDAAMHIYGDYEFHELYDDADRVGANLQWWNEFASYCESINPEVYLVGEAWQNNEVLAEYVQPFDTKFNFAFEQNMMHAIKNENAVLVDGTELSVSLQNILEQYDAVDENYLDGIFGTNHDQDRVMSQVDANVQKAKLAANIYLTLSGNPYLYYGEEIGMLGSGVDENKRTPFLWGADNSANTLWESDSQNGDTKTLEEQMTDAGSMYHHYKNLIALRKSEKALYSGDYKAIATGNKAVFAYTREYEGEKVTIIHNLSAKTENINVDVPEGAEVIYESGTETGLNGKEVTLGAYSSIIIK